MNAPPLVVAFCGPMGAGKSTLATALGALVGARVYSFGGMVRSEAVSRGLGTDRAALQTLGGAMHRELGAAGMVARLIPPRSGEVVLVDGVRHLDVHVALGQAARTYRLVSVIAAAGTLELRRSTRGREDVGLPAHDTESELAILEAQAHYRIRSDAIPAAEAAHGLAALIDYLRAAV